MYIRAYRISFIERILVIKATFDEIFRLQTCRYVAYQLPIQTSTPPHFALFDFVLLTTSRPGAQRTQTEPPDPSTPYGTRCAAPSQRNNPPAGPSSLHMVPHRRSRAATLCDRGYPKVLPEPLTFAPDSRTRTVANIPLHSVAPPVCRSTWLSTTAMVPIRELVPQLGAPVEVALAARELTLFGLLGVAARLLRL